MKKWFNYAAILILLAVLSTKFLQPVDAMSNRSAKDVACLAHNIYFEAHNQGFEGRKAVANVTINRVKSDKFSDSVCGVVYDKSKRLDGTPYCEFSWAKVTNGIYCSSGGKHYNKEIYNDIKELSKLMLSLNHFDNTGGALFYHADYVNGGWFKRNLTFIKQIERHKFYKYKD